MPNTTDRCVARQRTDEDRSESHQNQGGHQGRFPADPVPEVTEDRRAERTRREADELGPERRQNPDER